MNIIKEESFKGTHNSKPTGLYTLKNNKGMVAQITNFGAKIVSIYVPDRNGNMNDIMLGYDTIGEYISGDSYFGAICGRCANRIANGKFVIDGQTYQLPINNEPNSLHGGPDGFNNQVFEAGVVEKTANGQAVVMTYISKDGEMGYPGTLKVKITYTLNENNELRLDFEATTDKVTHVNICSHGYFNLSGEGTSSMLDHEMMINADKFTPITELVIPTGELKPVAGTPMDFTKPTVIGKRINEKYDQLDFGKGYDHNWVINKKEGELGLAAVYYDPSTGRQMEVLTTQPGVQFYSGNWLNGSPKGKGGKAYPQRSALCLETQNFPDSPNHSNFPSTLLKPGEVYKHICIYKFSTK